MKKVRKLKKKVDLTKILIENLSEICIKSTKYFPNEIYRVILKERHCKRFFLGDGKYTVTPTVTVIVSAARLKLTRYRVRDNFGDPLLESLHYFISVTDIDTHCVTHYSYRHI